MTGPKTNEGATAVGERTGTRAVVKYVRSSASKARVVLDLIRGLDVARADEVLRFADRDVASTIRKALTSAVANSEHNDNQAADELYVAACFADEGPTLKRYRPRARGRAGRIRKRTCHITVIVRRMSDEQLEAKRRREEARPTATRGRVRTAAAARRERVARSRQRAAAARGEQAPAVADEGRAEDEGAVDAADEADDAVLAEEAPEDSEAAVPEAAAEADDEELEVGEPTEVMVEEAEESDAGAGDTSDDTDDHQHDDTNDDEEGRS